MVIFSSYFLPFSVIFILLDEPSYRFYDTYHFNGEQKWIVYLFLILY